MEQRTSTVIPDINKDIISKLIKIIKIIPWFTACHEDNILYDEKLDKVIIDFLVFPNE